MWGIIILFTCMSALPRKLSPDLSRKIKSTTEEQVFHVFIFPKDQPDYQHLKRDFGDNKKGIADYLRDFAERSQRNIIKFLRSERACETLRNYWVANVIEASLTGDMLLSLAEREDVGYIEEVPVVRLTDVFSKKTYGKERPKNVSWNIRKVNADTVWSLGYTGNGVIVGTMDTGVDVDHPALSGKWSGYWKDFIWGLSEPYDDNGHGTHVMGIILGGDGPGPFPDDIGVAPGAQFVAVKVFTSSGIGLHIMAGMNWYASLVADSGVPVRVINNSWGSPWPTSLAFWDAILTWRSLDIIPVFAIGNSGPDSGTTETPGNYPTVIGVGVINQNDTVPDFSSRGPAPNMSPWNNSNFWERPDWNLTKPDITAPGVYIWSSLPGGNYGGLSGTSIAAPHVTGVIALLLSKDPFAEYNILYNTLLYTCYRPPQVHKFPNNNYGWGIVNALDAIKMLSPGTQSFLALMQVSVEHSNLNSFNPGDTAEIVVRITNYSHNIATNTIGVLSTDCDQYVTIINGTSSFGDVEWGDTAISAPPFKVFVHDHAPIGISVPFELHLSCNVTDTFVFHFNIPIVFEYRDYLDIAAGNALLTVTDRGAIGFLSSEQIEGNGFVYPLNGEIFLQYGSFAVGNSADYVADVWYKDLTDDQDWLPTEEPDGRVHYLPDPPRNADIAAIAFFDDSGHPDSRGITVRQLAYAYDKPNFSDFVILEYRIKNEGTTIFDNLYAALFMFFNIPGNSPYNYARVDSGHKTVYNWNYTDHGGVALLYPETPANLSVISYEEFHSGVLSDSLKIKYMNGTYHHDTFGSPGYYAMVVSAGPFFLAPGDSQKVAFAVVGGTNSYLYMRNVNRADSVYHDSSLVLVKEDNGSENRKHLKVRTNISKSQVTISFSLPLSEKIELNIYDVTGRKIKEILNSKLSPGEYKFHWDVTDDMGRAVGSGIYFVRIRSKSFKSTEKLLILR
ncbi:MAG: S8 family serine peptidase [Candidatus Hydrothermae bacterium]|nr:S8 family serine peptidase [Candidatus Hydrothermae bacterium]